MKEIWKDIVGYEGQYQISNLGNVLSLNYMHTRKPHLLKTRKTYDGYNRVNLCMNGKAESVSIHSLVAKAFIPNPDNKPQINHIDGNKDNNCVSNLEWVTGKENIHHAISTGLRKAENHIYPKGVSHYASKPILQYDLKGNFIKKWDCQSDAARFYNIPVGSINNCIHGRSYSFKGYLWREYKGSIPQKIEIKHHNFSPRIIKQYSVDGELLRVWNGYKEIIKENPNYRPASISACVSGKKRTTYGYVWKSEFI